MHSIKTILFLTLFLINLSLFSQEKFTLSGTITEQKSNETLISVNILFPDLETGTTTNEYGFYSITLPKGTYKVVISYVGFNDITETISLTQNISKNFSLTESAETLNEVVIKKNIEKLNIRTPQMSVNALTSPYYQELLMLAKVLLALMYVVVRQIKTLSYSMKLRFIILHICSVSFLCLIQMLLKI